MSSKPLYQSYIDLIEELGGEVKYSNEGRKHIKIYFTKPGSDKEQFYIAPKTPSDRRALINAKSTIRRLLSLGAEDAQSVEEDAQSVEEYEENEEQNELTFGQKVRTLRERKQLSRAKLAEEAGVNPELIEFFENAPKQPFLEYEMMLRLSTALGTTLSYLTKGEVMEGTLSVSGSVSDDLAQRVRQRRDELNLTIGALSERTGIPPNQLTSVEYGMAPDFYRLSELAKGLGVTEEFLKTGKKDETPAAILNLTEQEEALNKINTARGLGAYLQDRRVKLDISQLELGQAIGQNYPSEISKMERGVSSRVVQRFAPTIATVLQLPADALQAAADRVTPPIKRPYKVHQRKLPLNPESVSVWTGKDTPDSEAERRKRLVEQVIMDHTSSPQPEIESGQLADLLTAIHNEGQLTRQLLEQQHREVLEIVKGIQSESIKDTLHGLIDNLFKRG